MNVEEIMNWWKEHFDGLEIDCCPAVDLPDSDRGGKFAVLALPAADTADRGTLTAAFAYVLAKYTAQYENLYGYRRTARAALSMSPLTKTPPAATIWPT